MAGLVTNSTVPTIFKTTGKTRVLTGYLQLPQKLALKGSFWGSTGNPPGASNHPGDFFSQCGGTSKSVPGRDLAGSQQVIVKSIY